MGRPKKSTRKFEKNHLKDTLGRRKEAAKLKQRHQVKEKKKLRRAKEQSKTREDDPSKSEAADRGDADAADALENMDVDQFFQGGFDIPQMPVKEYKKPGRVKETKKNGRKRKRDAEGDGESDASSLASYSGLDEVVSPSDIDSGSELGEDDLDAHKRDLDALAEKDPEFYEFLKENDAELLDIDGSKDLAELGGLKGENADGKPAKRTKITEDENDEVKAGGAETLDMDMLAKWRTNITELNSLRSMKEVVLAFRAAAHVSEEDEKNYKYTISSPEVFHELLVLALNKVPEVLNHHLPVKEKSGKAYVVTSSKKFRSLTPLLKSHTASINHLLTTLSDAGTLKMTLSSIESLLPYVLSFKKLLRGLIKTIVDVWASPASSEATRINAFLTLRRLTVIGDAGLREVVLKSVYQGLVKGSRNTTWHTLPGVNLMKNSAAELWGIDPSVGYTTGFSYIRQLAIHLRGSITNPSKESYKTVYNWQYVHSLDFWSRVLTMHCDRTKEIETGKESALRPLVYPVVQITLGAMRLIATAQYFPLRFQLIRALLRISRATGTYIPLAPALLEVLSSAEMKKPPKPSTLKSLDFATAIRAPKAYLRTRVYQDGAGEQVAELLSEFLAQWAKTIAFPELALPVSIMLKRWLKDASSRSAGNKNGKVTAMLALLVQKLEANARWIEERRAKVDFAPNNRAGVEGFLKDVGWEKSPLGAFVVGQRKQREERLRLMEEGRREEEQTRHKRGGGRKGDEDGAFAGLSAEEEDESD